MDYATVCSGIEAPTVAWHSLGWNPVWFSEIEKFPSLVLKHYYPHVPNLGDMLKIENNEVFKSKSINLLCGGTPCQSFSVAGLRTGLADVRGNLALEFCRILDRKKPKWFVWENVPGALSSTGGGDFAAIISAFSFVGYSCAWRVFDAKNFGVPQRRRRVFVVGYFGNDWRPPAAVLFERESLFGNPEKIGEKGQEIAGTLDARTTGGGFPGSDGAANGHIIPYNITFNDVNGRRSDRPNGGLYVNKTETHSILTRAAPSETLMVGTWWDGGQTAQTLDAVLHKGQTMPEKNRFPALLQGPNPTVRRITPLEAERLQGFPDNYTAIPGAKDSPRYKAIGNSMAVPVMKWIGNRINIADKIF